MVSCSLASLFEAPNAVVLQQGGGAANRRDVNRLQEMLAADDLYTTASQLWKQGVAWARALRIAKAAETAAAESV